MVLCTVNNTFKYELENILECTEDTKERVLRFQKFFQEKTVKQL